MMKSRPMTAKERDKIETISRLMADESILTLMSITANLVACAHVQQGLPIDSERATDLGVSFAGLVLSYWEAKMPVTRAGSLH